MEHTPFLSIITPTYNRGHLLPNCFASLLCQTCMDFEWILVDDGSTDQTPAVVSEFQTDRFPVRYLRKENGGKHTALNTALPHVHGNYVLILDSDDTLTEHAVSRIQQEWSRYGSNPRVGVLAFLKGSGLHDPNCMSTVENRPVDYFRCKRRILRSCDCCEVLRVEIFKAYPFPVFPGESFLPETALWSLIGLTYSYVYINEIIYLCEYLEDGLTRSGRMLRISNPLGGMYTARLNMHPRNQFAGRIKNGLLYCCYGFFAGKSAGKLFSDNAYPILTALCIPSGWLLFRYWKRKYHLRILA